MATTRHPIGQLAEALTVQSNNPPSAVVALLEQTGGTATATTATPHGLQTGDWVTIRGADPDGYNGAGTIQVTVTDDTHFTYPVADDLVSPATGSITVDWWSDAQGGTAAGWRDVGQLWGQVTPLTAGERIAAEGIAAIVAYRVTVHYQPGLSPKQRLLWYPYAEPLPTILEIVGVLPHRDPDWAHRYLWLECTELQGRAVA